MKYLPSMIVAGSLLLAVVVPAFGRDRQENRGTSIENDANITNVSVAVANTGLNRVRDEENRMTTGNAQAETTATVARVNQTTLGHETEQLKIENEARIRNTSLAVANSGLNSGGEESRLRTGNATAYSDVLVTDVNVTGFGGR